MSRSIPLFLGLLVAIALALVWLTRPGSESQGEGALTPGAGGMEGGASALAPGPDQLSPGELGRRVQAGSAEAAAPLDPGPEERARREAAGGIVLVLAGPDGSPVSGERLVASWRKGWEDYGEDEGTTDERGRFPTTIPGPWMLEHVQVRGGAPANSLEHPGPFSPLPSHPTEVHLRLPREGRLHGTLREPSGAGIADIGLNAELVPALQAPFEHRLSRAGAEARSAADGSWSMTVPLGTYLLAPDETSGTWSARHEVLARISVQRPELEVPIRLLSNQGADLRVIVNLPTGFRGEASIVAHARVLDDPPMPTTEGIRLLPLEQERIGVRQPDGIFVVQGLAPGNWRLRGRADGCLPIDVSIPRGADRLAVTFLPAPPEPEPAVVRGVLLGGDGGPIQGQVLMITDWRTSGAAWGDRTDSEGRFEVPLGVWGKYLRAEAPGHCWTIVGPLDRASPPDFVEIRLEAERDIRGTVLDGGGRAVQARVVMRRAASSVRPVVPTGTEPPFVNDVRTEDTSGTGPDGTFHFAGIPEGPHELWAYPEDRALPPGRAVVRGGETDVQLILGANLEDLVTIRGRVRDALSGEPLSGVAVYARPAGGSASFGSSGLSDEEGRFSLRGHPPGSLELWAEPPVETARHHAFLTRRPETFGAGEHERDLDLPPARTLRLIVVGADGGALWGVEINVLDEAGVEVDLQDASGQNDGSSAHSDANGRVDLRGLPAGRVTLLALRQRVEDYRFGRPNYRLLEEGEEEDPVAFEIDLTRPVPELMQLALPW